MDDQTISAAVLPPLMRPGGDQVEDGNRAFAHTDNGKTFRNSEVYTIRNGQLVATEVYFGWDVPHQVPKGKHIDNEGEGHA